MPWQRCNSQMFAGTVVVYTPEVVWKFGRMSRDLKTTLDATYLYICWCCAYYRPIRPLKLLTTIPIEKKCVGTPVQWAALGCPNQPSMTQASPTIQICIHLSVKMVLFLCLGRAMSASYSAPSARTWQGSSTAPFSSRVGNPRRIACSLLTASPYFNRSFSLACYQQLSVNSRIGWWESPKKPALSATSWRAAHLLSARL